MNAPTWELKLSKFGIGFAYAWTIKQAMTLGTSRMPGAPNPSHPQVLVKTTLPAVMLCNRATRVGGDGFEQGEIDGYRATLYLVVYPQTVHSMNFDIVDLPDHHDRVRQAVALRARAQMSAVLCRSTRSNNRLCVCVCVCVRPPIKGAVLFDRSASVYCRPRMVWRQQPPFHEATTANHPHGSM